ncbi:MAG: energy transducer TonB [Proteobacteria bacterium]|nr:energy transducer TonB [Pseudomonadota bacterium]
MHGIDKDVRRRGASWAWVGVAGLLAVQSMAHAVPAVEDEGEEQGLSPGEVLVVERGDGGRYWQLEINRDAKRVPRYPQGLLEQGIEGCVNVGFVISAQGIPERFRILKSGSNQPSRQTIRQFGSAVVAVLKHWRWRPGPENPAAFPGFASVPMGFGVIEQRSGGAVDWHAHCRIEDLGAFMRAGG